MLRLLRQDSDLFNLCNELLDLRGREQFCEPCLPGEGLIKDTFDVVGLDAGLVIVGRHSGVGGLLGHLGCFVRVVEVR